MECVELLLSIQCVRNGAFDLGDLVHRFLELRALAFRSMLTKGHSFLERIKFAIQHLSFTESCVRFMLGQVGGQNETVLGFLYNWLISHRRDSNDYSCQIQTVGERIDVQLIQLHGSRHLTKANLNDAEVIWRAPLAGLGVLNIVVKFADENAAGLDDSRPPSVVANGDTLLGDHRRQQVNFLQKRLLNEINQMQIEDLKLLHALLDFDFSEASSRPTAADDLRAVVKATFNAFIDRMIDLLMGRIFKKLVASYAQCT